MPVEESGNVLLLATALAEARGTRASPNATGRC